MNLIDYYHDIVMEKPLLGWGNYGWPLIHGNISIDNHYLWLTLRHGFIALGSLVLILLATLHRLFWVGMTLPRKDHVQRSLAFTLIGILLSQIIVFYTVFMGGQTQTLLFILIGWSEGFVLSTKIKKAPVSLKLQPVLT